MSVDEVLEKMDSLGAGVLEVLKKDGGPTKTTMVKNELGVNRHKVRYRLENHLEPFELVDSEFRKAESKNAPLNEVKFWWITEDGEEALKRFHSEQSEGFDVEGLYARVNMLEDRLEEGGLSGGSASGELEGRVSRLEKTIEAMSSDMEAMSEFVKAQTEDELFTKEFRRELNTLVTLGQLTKQMAIEKYGEDEAKEMFEGIADDRELVQVSLYEDIDL